MGTRALGARLVAATFGLLLLAGCGDDGSSATPGEPAASATADPPSTSPTGSAELAGPPAATGPRLAGDTVSVRAPDDWVRDDAMVRWMQIAQSRDGSSYVQLSHLVGTPSGVPLGQLAENSLNTAFPDNGRRHADVTLDGVDFYRVSGTEPDGLYIEDYGADHLGDLVTLRFHLDPGVAKKERRELIGTVLATLRWD